MPAMAEWTGILGKRLLTVEAEDMIKIFASKYSIKQFYI